jgi:hypothetical protein
MTNAVGATTDIGGFRSSVDSWLDQNRPAFVPDFQGRGNLD